jgi:hypothetical protein
MTNPNPSPPHIFRQETSPAGVIFLTGVIALFGGMLLLGFLSKISYLGPDEWFIGIFGAALLVFDVLLIRYFRRPGIVLTDSAMLQSRLFNVRQVRYADLAELSAYLERIHPPLIDGRRMPPRIVHRLRVKTREKKEFMVTLPAFGNNGALLQALERCSGIPVVRLPDVDRGK